MLIVCDPGVLVGGDGRLECCVNISSFNSNASIVCQKDPVRDLVKFLLSLIIIST